MLPFALDRHRPRGRLDRPRRREDPGLAGHLRVGREHPVPPRDGETRACSPARRCSLWSRLLLVARRRPAHPARRRRGGRDRPAVVWLLPLVLGCARPGLLPVAQRDPGGRPARGRARRGVRRSAPARCSAGCLRWCCWRCSPTPRSTSRRTPTSSVPTGAAWLTRSDRPPSRGRSSPPTASPPIPLKIYLAARELGPAPVAEGAGFRRSTSSGTASSCRSGRCASFARAAADLVFTPRGSTHAGAGRRRRAPRLVDRFVVRSWIIGRFVLRPAPAVERQAAARARARATSTARPTRCSSSSSRRGR